MSVIARRVRVVMLQERLQWVSTMRPKSRFSGSRLSIEKILALTYAWAHKFTTTQAVHETSLEDEKTPTETVTIALRFVPTELSISRRGQ